MVACVLAGLLLGIGGSVGVNTWLNRPPATSTVPAPTATRLLTADGVEVGSVGLTRRDDRAYLLLNVTAGQTFAAQIMRDSAGSNFGGVYPHAATVTAWGTAPSALLVISRLEPVPSP